MTSTYNFKHQKAVEYKAIHEPEGDDHTTFINYLWLGIRAGNNYADIFPCFVWKTVFLHLDSFETVYEFLINHKHRPNPSKRWYHSKDICCRTIRQGLTDFMYDSFGIIPIEIQFVPNERTYDLRDSEELNRRLTQMDYDFFYKPFPHSAKTSKELLQHNTYWRRVIYVDYDYNLIQSHRNTFWTLTRLLKKTSLQWGHIVNVIVRSDMLPNKFKPHTSDGVLDLPKLKQFHLEAISKILEPEKSFNDDSFRMQYRFEIEERAKNVFNTKSETFEAQQRLLKSLFRNAPERKSLVKTFVSNGECRVNLNHFQSSMHLKKIPDPMDNGFLLNQYPPIVDLVIKCNSSMKIRFKKLITKITDSCQKKNSSPTGQPVSNVSRYWIRLYTSEDKLQFLQHCFPVYAKNLTPIPKSQPTPQKTTLLKTENKQEPMKSTYTLCDSNSTLETNLSKPTSAELLRLVERTKTVKYVKFRLQ
ncbi:hypothetical protein WICPIJ_002709 [Wickerhamomyces pijperi]|uniref:Uncharacterized protein n=1 Tax=Wickerhamomyces pijperi TaxID=599730 RepID=A0A9P8Q988_WICPI|nr:hypothetical protein WICPIJ_002709 [Wickerhamomyces pijperi]